MLSLDQPDSSIANPTNTAKPMLILYDTDLYRLSQVVSVNVGDKQVFLLLS